MKLINSNKRIFTYLFNMNEQEPNSNKDVFSMNEQVPNVKEQIENWGFSLDNYIGLYKTIKHVDKDDE